MNRADGFMTLGARLPYWMALAAVGFIGAMTWLGRAADALGGAA